VLNLLPPHYTCVLTEPLAEPNLSLTKPLAEANLFLHETPLSLSLLSDGRVELVLYLVSYLASGRNRALIQP